MAHSLHSTGVVGYPDEFFLPEQRAERWSAAGASTQEEYLEHVFELGTAPNGVFAAKLMWNYFDSFMGDLRNLVGFAGPDLAVIRAAFPEPSFICVRREDVVAQGVSWALAAQTDQYAAHQERTREPVFDFQAIDGLVKLAADQTRRWRHWFAGQGLEPLEVTYEEFCADITGMTRRALEFLGLEALPGRRIGPPPALRKQADAVNADWIARYRRLADD